MGVNNTISRKKKAVRGCWCNKSLNTLDDIVSFEAW